MWENPIIKRPTPLFKDFRTWGMKSLHILSAKSDDLGEFHLRIVLELLTLALKSCFRGRRRIVWNRSLVVGRCVMGWSTVERYFDLSTASPNWCCCWWWWWCCCFCWPVGGWAIPIRIRASRHRRVNQTCIANYLHERRQNEACVDDCRCMLEHPKL